MTKNTHTASNVASIHSFYRRCLNFISSKISRCLKYRATTIASVLVIFHTKTHENSPNTTTLVQRKPPPSTINSSSWLVSSSMCVSCFACCLNDGVLPYSSRKHSYPDRYSYLYKKEFVKIKIYTQIIKFYFFNLCMLATRNINIIWTKIFIWNIRFYVFKFFFWIF